MSERAVYHESDLWRNLRRAGIPEAVIMKIGGWRTQSVFERYAIVSRNDIADAMRKLQQSEQTPQIGTLLVTFLKTTRATPLHRAGRSTN
jgi:hypothetical protein